MSVTAEYTPGSTAVDGGRLPLQASSYLDEGETPLVRLDDIAGALGLDAVWAKLEGNNPTGSHKDRMSQMIVARAEMLGLSRIIAASSGNAGISLATTAARAGLRATIVTQRNAPGRWVAAIREAGGEILESTDTLTRWHETNKRVLDNTHYPATNYLCPPVGSNPFGVQGYKAVAHELIRDLGGQAIDAVVVATDRGDLLWGVYEGLVESHDAGAISIVPRLVAVEPFARLSNVMTGADYRSGFPGSSAQVSIGGSTVTWQAVQALRATNGLAVVVDDSAAAESRVDLRRLGIEAELSSAATLHALRSLRAQNLIARGARVALLITSDGRYSPDSDDG